MKTKQTFIVIACYLDLGSDFGSPVSLNYFGAAPFKFNGTPRHQHDQVRAEQRQMSAR
jgi:hypothetical protein